MKRRKDDEKSMGPMFPRLHVNDTEKGGPRAPPRNKMALYEQLSIPSQGFNPLKPNSNNNHVPPPSSSQVNGSNRNAFVPHQLTPSAPTFQLDKLNTPESGRVRAVTSLARSGSAEDDFAVPIFIQSTAVYGKSATKKSSDKLTLTDSNSTVQLKRIQRANGNDPKDSSSNVDLRQDLRSQTAIERKESATSSGVGENSPKNLLNVGGFGKSIDEIEKSKSYQATRLHSENVARDYGLKVTLTLKNNEVGPPSIPRHPPSGDIQCVDDGECASDERSNDGSDASVVDPVSAMDISPDDVVGIIGQKHFWKARKAIINQQRIFAVQVFELHRLIKVQKLIAGSRHLMLEDASVTTTISPPTEAVALDLDLDLEVNANCPSPAIAKQHQEHREPSKLSHPAKECSAENTVWKPSNRSPTLGTTAPDTWAGPWGGPGSGPGPSPNQWLVPMMSPTEGLVYKPCPGPVFRSSALMGSFPNQGFAYPHQPFFPSYYGMMPVAVSRQGSEEMNLEPVSFETNHCNASKECAADFQGSTPSSPIKKAAKTSLENRGVVSNNQSSELNHQLPRRVIKAVPHNRRSASESVARIFRSIQEERKR